MSMCCRQAPDRNPRAGFTLFEVLVAAALGVLLLTLLLRTFSGAWSEAAQVRESAEAMIVARAVIEKASQRATLAPGIREGRSGAYGWAVSIVEIALPEPPKPPPARPSAATPAAVSPTQTVTTKRWKLYRVGTVVIAPSGRRTTLETMRLAPAPG